MKKIASTSIPGLEEARWSGKMRKSPGQDDLHGEEEMDEQCQLNFICKLDKTVYLQVKKEATWTLFGECSPFLHMTCIFKLQSRLSSLQIPLK